jgi:hypothetical protein
MGTTWLLELAEATGGVTLLLSVSEETGRAGRDETGACFEDGDSIGMERLRADSADAPIVLDAVAGAETVTVATGVA